MVLQSLHEMNGLIVLSLHKLHVHVLISCGILSVEIDYSLPPEHLCNKVKPIWHFSLSMTSIIYLLQ
jgi:hypothetical protein